MQRVATRREDNEATEDRRSGLRATGVSGGNRAVAVVLLLCVSSCFAFAWGMALASVARGVMLDFKVVYFGARCLVQHHDSYNQSELLRVYFAEGGEPVPEAAKGYRTQMIVANQIYLPTAAMLTLPFGLLPWPIAHLVWSALTVCGITLAAVLVWSEANQYDSSAPLYIISFLLFNSGVLFAGGNPAGVAVSLCVIAAWCFLGNRFVNLGIACMAISLAIKPHDTGLIWLFFLLTSGECRKRALNTLLAVALIGIIALAWIHQISPHWLSELQSNLQAYAVRGSYHDPGPVANKTIGPGMIIDLQTVTSVIRDDPPFYQIAAYLLCAPLLLYWAFLTARSQFSRTRAWFALGAIAPLALLPVYHRPYDAKLLLMAIPMCAILWSRGRRDAWISVALTGIAVFFTSDLPLALLSSLTKQMHIPAGAGGKVITILLMRPAPLALLLLGVFNLLQYAKACRPDVEADQSGLASLTAVLVSQE